MEKHDLHHEFPEFDQRITELKVSNAHFKNLAEDYHETNKKIHQIETSGVFTEDELNELRKTRLSLKDKIYDMLKS